ncbi:hypothetical protein D3C80_2155080 [compost metagenome]
MASRRFVISLERMIPGPDSPKIPMIAAAIKAAPGLTGVSSHQTNGARTTPSKRSASIA